MAVCTEPAFWFWQRDRVRPVLVPCSPVARSPGRWSLEPDCLALPLASHSGLGPPGHVRRSAFESCSCCFEPGDRGQVPSTLNLRFLFPQHEGGCTLKHCSVIVRLG